MAASFSLFVRLSQHDLNRCIGILIYKYLCYTACSLSIYLSILIYNYLSHVLLYACLKRIKSMIVLINTTIKQQKIQIYVTNVKRIQENERCYLINVLHFKICTINTLNDKTFVLLTVGSVSLGIKSAVHLRRLMTQFYHNAAVFHINVGDANS